MRNPNVLGIVSYKVFPAQMGGQKHIVDFYNHLSAQTDIVLVTSKENGNTGEHPYPVLPFLYNHWKGILNLRYIFRLKKLVQQHNMDVICIEHSYFGWMGMLLRWLTKKPFVIRSQNIEAHRFRDMGRPWWRLYEWYEKMVHRKADHSFFITEEDNRWALQQWQLAPDKCSVLTYGMPAFEPVSAEKRRVLKQQLLSQYAIPAGTRLFLFNGSLNYIPNIDALRIIVNEIIPVLTAVAYPFRLFICGKDLDEQWVQVLRSCPGIIYTGFVEDIDLYLDCTDCFINPVTLGGGIRTKLVQALAHDQFVISTKTGAQGINTGITGNKLVIVNDYDWKAFAGKMMEEELPVYTPVPTAFQDEFNWNSIVQKALLSLQTL